MQLGERGGCCFVTTRKGKLLGEVGEEGCERGKVGEVGGGLERAERGGGVALAVSCVRLLG